MHLSSLKKFAKYGAAALAKAGASLAGLTLSFVLARIAGAETAGLYFLFFSVLSILSVAARAGSDNLLLKFVPPLRSHGNYSGLRSYIRYTCILIVAISVVLGATILLNERLLRIILDLGADADLLWRILVATLPIYSLVLASSFYYQAVGRSSRSIVVAGVAIPATLVLLIICAAGAKLLGISQFDLRSANTVFTLFLVAVVTVAILVWLSLRQEPELRSEADDSLSFKQLGEKFKYSLPFFAVAVLNVISLNITNLAAGVFLGPVEVAFLAVSTKIATAIALILTAVNVVAAPEFSRLFALGDADGLKQLYRETRRVTLVVGLIPFLIVAMFPEAILGFFGSDFRTAGKILIVIAIGQFINAATGPVTYLLQMTGNQNLFMWWTIVMSMVTIMLSVVLTLTHGAIGSAVAISVSVVVTNVGSLILVRRRLGFN